MTCFDKVTLVGLVADRKYGSNTPPTPPHPTPLHRFATFGVYEHFLTRVHVCVCVCNLYLCILQSTLRTGWIQNDVKQPESVASHMYRMAVMTFLIDSTDGLDKNQ